jgi:hypothetical protein
MFKSLTIQTQFLKMSYSNKQINNKFNNKSAKIAPKPYCKVCHDAGKSEAEYTNHFVRSSPAPDAVVVCPTLLSQQCAYCEQSGHTQSYCKLKLKAEKQWLKEAKKQTFEIISFFNYLLNIKSIFNSSIHIQTDKDVYFKSGKFSKQHKMVALPYTPLDTLRVCSINYMYVIIAESIGLI